MPTDIVITADDQKINGFLDPANPVEVPAVRTGDESEMSTALV